MKYLWLKDKRIFSLLQFSSILDLFIIFFPWKRTSLLLHPSHWTACYHRYEGDADVIRAHIFGVFPVQIRNVLLKQVSSSSPLTALLFTPWGSIRAHEIDPFWLQEMLCGSTSDRLPLLTVTLSLGPDQSSHNEPPRAHTTLTRHREWFSLHYRSTLSSLA